jgi:coronin-7
MSWNLNGSKLATICKDGFIRVYEPIESETPLIQEKAGPPAGGKSARIEWVMNGKALLISGFGK